MTLAQADPALIPPPPILHADPRRQGEFLVTPLARVNLHENGAEFQYEPGPSDAKGPVDRVLKYRNGRVEEVVIYRLDNPEGRRATKVFRDGPLASETSFENGRTEHVGRKPFQPLSSEEEQQFRAQRSAWMDKDLLPGAQVIYEPASLTRDLERPFLPAYCVTSSRRNPGLNLEYAYDAVSASTRAFVALQGKSGEAVVRFLAPAPDGYTYYVEFMRHQDGFVTGLVLDTALSAEKGLVYPDLQKAAVASRWEIGAWTYLLPDLQRRSTGCEIIAHGLAQASFREWEAFRDIHLAMRDPADRASAPSRPIPPPDETVLYGAMRVYYDQGKMPGLLPSRPEKDTRSGGWLDRYYEAAEKELQVVYR